VSNITGEHWIIEFYDCPADILDDLDLLRAALNDACETAQLTVLQLAEHAFTPQGVTMLGLLSESHMSIHTWPEEGYAAIDIFTCGDKELLNSALEGLLAVFKPQKHELQIVRRGPR